MFEIASVKKVKERGAKEKTGRRSKACMSRRRIRALRLTSTEEHWSASDGP